MEAKSIQKYQNFLGKIHLVNQTFLIDALLRQDKHLDYFNSIINSVEYKLSLSDGGFSGTDDLLTFKRQEVVDQLSTISLKLKENLLEKDHRELLLQKGLLEADITKLEEAVGRKRQIYYWYLVPFWLSAILIDMGEVVFRSLGCNWWGVSSILQDHCSMDEILLEIVEEMNKSQSILN